MARTGMGKPKIRLPRKFKKDDIIQVRVEIRHPSTTGLKLVDEEKNLFERDKPSFYLRKMDVIYGNDLVTEFYMTAATSPDPLIRFNLKATKEAPLKIIFTNSKDQKFEVSTNVKFTA